MGQSETGQPTIKPVRPPESLGICGTEISPTQASRRLRQKVLSNYLKNLQKATSKS